jgi:hypothetical protein
LVRFHPSVFEQIKQRTARDFRGKTSVRERHRERIVFSKP